MRTRLAEAWESLATRRAEAVCVCLLVLMGANLLSVVWRKGLTADERPPETRYVAVGASYLNGALLLGVPVPQRLKVIEYRRRTPEAVFGNSIYLYRVRE